MSSLIITEPLANALAVPEPAARYLLALFISYPFAFMYHAVDNRGRQVKCEAPTHPIEGSVLDTLGAMRSVQHKGMLSKNLYFSLTGLWLIYFVFGGGIWHSLVDVILVYVILRLLGGSRVSLTLTWLITMGHLMGGYVYNAVGNQVHPITWTIPHCVLVLKLIGLAYNLYDGSKKQESLTQEQKSYSITTLPSFIEVAGFSFCFGSVLAGPQFSFVRYQKLISGKLFDNKLHLSSISAGIKRMLLGILLAVTYSLLNRYFPLNYLTSDEYAERGMLEKLFFVLAIGKVALWRYIAVWFLAEGACIITGLGYKGRREDGSIDWSAINNVHYVAFETSITLQGVIDTFNVNTNKWIAMYVYKRLKWVGNRNVSYMTALLFVALWHGVWPGYMINFSFEFISVIAEKQFLSFTKDHLKFDIYSLSWPLFIPAWLGAYLFKNLLLFYPVASFMLLGWSACYKFMTSVYYFGHTVVAIWYILYYLLLLPRAHSSAKLHHDSGNGHVINNGHTHVH